MTELKALLDRPIAFHRCFVDVSGSVTCALFLSQACYWSKIVNFDWFYKTQTEWELETGLSRREQETARRKLLSLGVLQEERRGAPARMFYRIDLEKLTILIGGKRQSSLSPVVQTRLAESANLYKEAETTTETTTENTLSSPSVQTEEFSLSEEPSAPREKKNSKADPRHRRFMELIFKAHEHFVKVPPSMGPPVGNNLKRLLKGDSRLDEARFRKMLTNYHESEDHSPADSPTYYIPKLPKYELGPLNKYGRPQETMGTGS